MCRLAEDQQVPPSALWQWAEAHSPALLALALAAGYTRLELALTKASDCAIDQDSLEMHAELNNCLVGAMVVRTLRRATTTEVDHRPPFANGLQHRTA